jgi:hypothetical protein
MEKLSDISILEKYNHRQVIINEYVDEDYLNERHGFHFQTVAVTEEGIVFTRKERNDFLIPLEPSTLFYVNDDFQSYYILRVFNSF